MFVASSRNAKMLDAWCSVLEKVSRIISGRKTKVITVQPPPQLKNAAGWTDGEDIFLNMQKMATLLTDLTGESVFLNTTPNQRSDNRANTQTRQRVLNGVRKLKGLIYHETSHILFTPREGSYLDEFVKSDEAAYRLGMTKVAVWWAYIGLEDQRIETLFAASNPAAAKYFQAAVLVWAVKDTSASEPQGYVLLPGRRYLDRKVLDIYREQFRTKFGDEILEELEDVVSEYIKLDLTKASDQVVACQLVMRFAKLLKHVFNGTGVPPMSQPSEDNTPQSGPTNASTIKVRTPSKNATQDANEQLEEREEEGWSSDGEDEDDPDEADGDDGAGNGTDENTADDDADADEGDGDGEGDSTSDDDADGKADKASKDKSKSTAAGRGSVDPKDADIGDVVWDVLQETLDDKEFIEDLGNLIKNVKNVASNNDGLGATTFDRFKLDTVRPAAKEVSRAVSHQIGLLRSELDRVKEVRQETGIIDPLRLVARNPYRFDVFNQFSEDRDEEGDVEAVILVDVSGSMTHNMPKVSEVMWSVKRAMDLADIPCSVIAYDEFPHTMYRPGERVDPSKFRVYPALGGTNPTDAMNQALGVLSRSTANNKLLVNITDGQWSQSDDHYGKIMAQFDQLGATTILLGLQGATYCYGTHGHQVAKDINDIKEVVGVVRSAITLMLRKLLAQAGR